jgi:hypothetical protein
VSEYDGSCMWVSEESKQEFLERGLDAIKMKGVMTKVRNQMMMMIINISIIVLTIIMMIMMIVVFNDEDGDDRR